MNLRPLTIVGIILTALYLIVWGFMLLLTWPDAKRLALNEWGDFFAGAMAPLALLWLVLGYFQQSIELHQNTEALRLQAEQLRQQVDETKLLVQETSAQAKASAQIAQRQADQAALEEIRAMPRFAVFNVERPNQIPLMKQIWVNFRNVGAPVTNLELLSVDPEPDACSVSPAGALEYDGKCDVILRFDKDRPDSFGFTLTYIDAHAVQRISEFRVHGRQVVMPKHFERRSQ